MASQIIRKAPFALNGKIINTIRSQSIVTCSALRNPDINDLKKIKEPRKIDQSLMTKESHDESSPSGMITIQKQEMIAPVTGVPEEHVKGRKARISLSVKNPMQSGTDNTHSWTMQFETRERWENPLMGWSSTGDPLSNMSIQFASKEDAINFCDKNGWEWFVEVEKEKPSKVKSYGINFSWNKRTRVSTK